jgi:hypothetical protein
MDEKGMSVTTAARLVKEQLPGASFNSANISHYRAGRSVPRPNVLRALSAILDVDPEELSPEQAPRDQSARRPKTASNSKTEAALIEPKKDPTSARIPHFHITEMHNGEALLQINQKLSWATAIKILKLLKIENSDDT